MGDLNSLVKSIKANKTIGLRLTRWLSENDEVRAETTEGEMLLVSMIGNTSYSRAGRFHASSSGSCPRKQMFEYLGVEPDTKHPASLRAIFHDGHFRHLRWQLMLLNAGIIDTVEKRYDLPELLVSGSVDGLNLEEGWIFELKGANPKVFEKVKNSGMCLPEHNRQIHVYFLLTGLDRAIIVYENKATQAYEEIEVKKDEDLMEEIRGEYSDLTEDVLRSRLPLMLKLCEQQQGVEYDRCPYAETCPDAEAMGIRP